MILQAFNALMDLYSEDNHLVQVRTLHIFGFLDTRDAIDTDEIRDSYPFGGPERETSVSFSTFFSLQSQQQLRLVARLTEYALNFCSLRSSPSCMSRLSSTLRLFSTHQN